MQSPVIDRRILGSRLRTARQTAGVDARDAEKHLGIGASMLSKIELGRTPIRVNHVIKACDLYQLPKQIRDELIDLAVRADAPGWWEIYAPQPWYVQYLGLETGAERVLTYEHAYVPGLFQTEDYARAIQSISVSRHTQADIERATGLRRARQARLDTTNHPLRVVAVIAEPALLWRVGGEDVMAAQARKLVELARQPHISIRILPFAAGAHAGMSGPFTLVQFDDMPDLDTVYLEHARGSYLEKPAEVERFRDVHKDLNSLSMGVEESMGWLDNLADDLSGNKEVRNGRGDLAQE